MSQYRRTAAEDNASIVCFLVNDHFAAQPFAGSHEVAIPKSANSSKHHSPWSPITLGSVARFQDQAGGLHQSLQHEDPWQDMEPRKVILQIFLGQSHIFQCDGSIWAAFKNLVYKSKVHESQG